MQLARASGDATPLCYLQVPFGGVHASILSRFDVVDVCGICGSNLWKRAQVSAASSSHETESGGGASEQTAVSAVDRISLDAAIAKFSDHDEADEFGGEILAAAIALRDSSGRDRLSTPRNLAGTWNVARREKVDATWKHRPLKALAEDIEAAVCDAALHWERSDVSEKLMGQRPQDLRQEPAQQCFRISEIHLVLQSTWTSIQEQQRGRQ